METPRCQLCNKSPAGMVGWPTDEDDYICIDCLRLQFKEMQKNLNMLYGQKFSDRNYHALKSRAETVETDLERLRQQVSNQVGDVQKMVFIRGILERAARADMNMETTDRYIVREIQRICKKE